MTNQKDIIGIVRELSERCDSDSHLSEELENARITPADLAKKLLIAVRALEHADLRLGGAKIDGLRNEAVDFTLMEVGEALSRINSL